MGWSGFSLWQLYLQWSKSDLGSRQKCPLWQSPSCLLHGHRLVQFCRCQGGTCGRGDAGWGSLSRPSPCILVRKILENPGCWKAQLRVSLLELISFMLFPRLPDWLRSVLKRWQHYLLGAQLPCSFSLPCAFSLYRTFDTEVDICTWKWYTEFWESLESVPLSTSMWLLTTEIYNSWGPSNSKGWNIHISPTSFFQE